MGRLRAVDGGKDRLLTVREVARLLGVSTATVYRLCEEGRLAHVRVGSAIRFEGSALAVIRPGTKEER